MNWTCRRNLFRFHPSCRGSWPLGETHVDRRLYWCLKSHCSWSYPEIWKTSLASRVTRELCSSLNIRIKYFNLGLPPSCLLPRDHAAVSVKVNPGALFWQSRSSGPGALYILNISPFPFQTSRRYLSKFTRLPPYFFEAATPRPSAPEHNNASRSTILDRLFRVATIQVDPVFIIRQVVTTTFRPFIIK